MLAAPSVADKRVSLRRDSRVSPLGGNMDRIRPQGHQERNAAGHIAMSLACSESCSRSAPLWTMFWLALGRQTVPGSIRVLNVERGSPWIPQARWFAGEPVGESAKCAWAVWFD
jgi:hypothetical protein